MARSSHITHWLIRHAQKEASDGRWGHEVSITSQGEKLSVEFGKKLSHIDAGVILTSPVKRCLETAQAIQKGYGRNIPIHPSTLLGMPGFFISGPELAEKAFMSNSLEALVAQIVTEERVEGFHPIQECTRDLIKVILHQDQSSVLVTHDICLCILACAIFETTNYQEMMPDFLDTLTLVQKEESLELHYKGLTVIKDAASFRGCTDSHVQLTD